MIPCKDCLVLAACKNKKNVTCELLFDWGLYNELSAEEHWRTVWQILPKCKRMRPHNKPWDDYQDYHEPR